MKRRDFFPSIAVGVLGIFGLGKLKEKKGDDGGYLISEPLASEMVKFFKKQDLYAKRLITANEARKIEKIDSTTRKRLVEAQNRNIISLYDMEKIEELCG